MGPSGTLTTLVALVAAVVLPIVCLRFGNGPRPSRPAADVTAHTSETPRPQTPAPDTAAAAVRPAARRAHRANRFRVPLSGSRRVRQKMARLGLVMACQLSGVMFVGIVANDWGQFYTSWSEIFGLSSNTPLTSPTRHFGAPSALSAPKSGTAAVAPHYSGAPEIPAQAASWKTTSWSAQDQWVQRGAIVSANITGATTGLSESVLVYLPPAYFHTGTAARALPILEVLTGYPGTASHLVSNLKYPDRLLADIQSGQARDMVMVMLQPAPTFPWDTECSNVPDGPQALTFFSTDVPNSISQQFGLSPTGYGAIGDSTGGYCAVKMSLVDPSRFTAGAMLSGYYAPATDRTTQGIFSTTTMRNQNNLVWLINHQPIPKVALLACTSRTEAGSDGFAVNQRLLAAVKAPMSADELLLPSGGHNFAAWGREIPYALVWLSAHLYAQTAPPPPVMS